MVATDAEVGVGTVNRVGDESERADVNGRMNDGDAIIRSARWCRARGRGRRPRKRPIEVQSVEEGIGRQSDRCDRSRNRDRVVDG